MTIRELIQELNKAAFYTGENCPVKIVFNDIPHDILGHTVSEDLEEVQLHIR